MLITFKTDAYESITLFGQVAQRLLTLMGQSGRVPGAILAHDVPKALALLTHAIDSEKSGPQSNQNEDPDDISLTHRAIPLIALLKAAVENHCDVMWES